MRRGNHRGTKHQQKYTIICDWCADRRETARETTKTCGPKCRKRLSGYVLHFGYAPDHPPGPCTLFDAVGLEVHRLIIEEQRRRKAKAEYLKATGTALPRDGG